MTGRPELEPLDPALYREVVRRAIAEDLGWGDVTTETLVAADLKATGSIVVKAPCVLAGLEVALETFRQLDPSVQPVRQRHDGQRCGPDETVARVTGFACALLTAERTALNFLQHLSGIATLTRKYVDAAAGRIVVLDTRKTVPTLRVLAKYAVRAGGGQNHRLTLDGAVLIKDNHVALAGGIRPALERARAAGLELPIEVEVQSLSELDEALAAGATRVLLDNFSVSDLQTAVRRTNGRAELEISGGVTLATLDVLAATGARYVSVGALTHSAPAIDISFELERAGV